MFPLQNQEPVIAYPCRHIGCPKKKVLADPRGPDNGEESFAGILMAWFKDGALRGLTIFICI